MIFVKGALLDPSRQIELEDYVMERANRAALVCADEGVFPSQSPDLVNGIPGIRFLVGQAHRYWEAVEPLLTALIPGCTWGQPHHDGIWTRAIQRVANVPKSGGGQAALLDLRRYPILPLLYGSGMAAIHRQKFTTLKAVAVDPKYGSEGVRIPLVCIANPFLAFGQSDLVGQVLALEAAGEDVQDEVIEALSTGGKGKRFTPGSDHLHDSLRRYFGELIPDDVDYDATFSRVEILLGALAADAAKQPAKTGTYLDGAFFGAFTWRDKWVVPPLEQKVLDELREASDGWPPLIAGLFGGKRERAEAALDEMVAGAALARSRRW
jgi:hypothetical protein